MSEKAVGAETEPRKCKLTSLPGQEVLARLRVLIKSERKITAEVVAYICEVNRRRLYLLEGAKYTTLFQFLTEGERYSGPAAQRRIDSARLIAEMPNLIEDLASGELNLSQAALVTKYFRQKAKEAPQWEMDEVKKQELMDSLKGKTLRVSERLLAVALEIEPKKEETSRPQADGTSRETMTFSELLTANLERIKELVSHSLPNPTKVELLEMLTEEFLKRKDPMRQKPKTRRPKAKKKKAQASDQGPVNSNSESQKDPEAPAAPEPVETISVAETAAHNETLILKSYWEDKQARIAVSTRRFVFQRANGCQECDPVTGERCPSRYQLQLDHIVSRWAGGTNDVENLQILCGVHNRAKYRREAGLEWV